MGQELGDEMKEKRIKKRKTDHIDICLNEDVEARNVTTGFEDVFFIHRALPETLVISVAVENPGMNTRLSISSSLSSWSG
ncbi:TPA: hypothetical protein EYP75_05070 [Candidatus Bathyarchaeota archaeon]|nr:hypothetical protein [Candidatus Bathyarchaeota archaeon]